MTVAELIEQLSEFNPELPVYYDDDLGPRQVKAAIEANAPKWATMGITEPKICWLSEGLRDFQMPR